MTANTTASRVDETPVNLEAGTYELIQRRLQGQKEDLVQRLAMLNAARKEVFSATNFVLKANQRISTENTGYARGIVAIGNVCIFGYNVHFGLRTDIKLEDVFSVFLFQDNQFTAQPLSLIEDANFLQDYQNLYRYYRDSIFSKFHKTENYLYMIFQTSKNTEDLKAFKWLIKDNTLHYENDRSIHEVSKAPQFEFEWVKTGLQDRRLGKFPHISILDKVFIEALHGDITFKIEDNTESGKGIYSETVSNLDQQLDDAEYYYADLGNMIAIRIKPYQEEFRAFVFNVRTKEVINLKSLNDSAILLPDHQGLIFSNGYYLQNGEYKIFDLPELEDTIFLRRVASPNGEDYLYVFTQRETNTYFLLSYNIIQQTVETPIVCNGLTIFEDGSLVYFRTEGEATRHHQVQIWETPYMAELKENEERREDPVFKVGNRQIVQAMAESQEVIQLINKGDSFEGLYEDIVRKSTSLLDSYFWIAQEDLHNLAVPLQQIKTVANTAIDEFVKVQAQRQHAEDTVAAAAQQLENLVFQINSTTIATLDQLVQQLTDTRKLQGAVIDLKNVRYVDLGAVDAMLERIQAINTDRSQRTVEFLLKEQALQPYEERVLSSKDAVAKMERAIDAREIEATNTSISSDLELLIDILNSLKIDDATQTTRIVEKISVIFASLNEVRAQLTRKLQSLRSHEAVAEFHAQLTLLEQSVVNYLELSTTADKTEEYYTKVVVQLEELEGRFSEFDDFALQIADKRDEIIKAFNAKREQIVEQLNKRSTALEQIGLRVLKNIENKAKVLTLREDILSFYASDLMVDKIRQLVAELREMQDVSKAESLENQLKKSQEDALRILRDKTELYVDGQNIIALGRHKFTVNNQQLSLTLVRRQEELYYHLTGTSFYQKVKERSIATYQDIWEQELVSENTLVYRAEYLAYRAFKASLASRGEFDAKSFIDRTAEQSYSENYVKGVHNDDALLIFDAVASTHQQLGLLRFDVHTRVIAQLFWRSLDTAIQERLTTLLRSSVALLKVFPSSQRFQSILADLSTAFERWETSLPKEQGDASKVADFIFHSFTQCQKFVLSERADVLRQHFLRYLEESGSLEVFKADAQHTDFGIEDRYYLVLNWLNSFFDQQSVGDEEEATYIEEAAVTLLQGNGDYELLFGKSLLHVEGLKGSHAVLDDGHYQVDYHDYIQKMERFATVSVPRFEAFVRLKGEISKAYERELKIHEFEPKVLTSFVRNKLINEVYFPLIGNNLAKQLGAAGENMRTARMGMLLLISPPGYGKTTLMEYLAKTMGLHFVKINGPTIGHAITSIDPVEAKTSGEREELKKINLAFEMADNVMLYLDDIQHLNPEFLQKFISLADGQRKIDGIFDGESKTYDLRGNRFCVVMAGNPYTESGSKFQIPDMLANRADVYNLGDVIGDTEHLFRLSLIENAAIENPFLEKIARTSFKDFYALIDFVEAGAEELPDLEGNFLTQEIEDFVAVLRHLFKIRDVVVEVNRQYILSAAMRDEYRTEPPFKMQGSYRNMSRLVASVVPMMNEKEINDIIASHYESESQTLTADTESNLLKLKDIAGLITPVERQRWEEIKQIFQKNNKHGGLGKDDKLFAQMLEFNENLEGIINAIKQR